MTKRETLRGLERKTSTRKPGLCLIMDDRDGVRCNWNTKVKKQTIVCVKTGETPAHEECDKCENEAHWLIIHVADASESPKTDVPEGGGGMYKDELPPTLAEAVEPQESTLTGTLWSPVTRSGDIKEGQELLPETKDDEPRQTLGDLIRSKHSLRWEI